MVYTDLIVPTYTHILFIVSHTHTSVLIKSTVFSPTPAHKPVYPHSHSALRHTSVLITPTVFSPTPHTRVPHTYTHTYTHTLHLKSTLIRWHNKTFLCIV